MSDLAETVQLSPSGVSRLVDRLVADGLLERRPCGADGRAVYAAITEGGRALLDEAEATYSAALRRLFVGQYTAQEYERLAALLLRVAPACRRRQAGGAEDAGPGAGRGSRDRTPGPRSDAWADSSDGSPDPTG